MDVEEEIINKTISEGISIGDVPTQENQPGKKNSNNDMPRLYNVEVNKVIHFEPETDYITETQLPCSYIIKTPMGDFCIDGYNKIKNAKENYIEEITVLAEYWDHHSDEELAIKKFTIRSVNTKERVYYIETMNHLKHLKIKHLNKNPDLIQFKVGGARRGLDNSAKLNALLSGEKDLSPDTISKYITDIRYLSFAAIKTLMDFQRQPKEKVWKYPNKDFFEEIRTKRDDMTHELEAEELEHEEIEKRISDSVLKAYEQYRTNQPIEEFTVKLQQQAQAIISVVDDMKKLINLNDDKTTSPTVDKIVNVTDSSPATVDDQTKANISQGSATVIATENPQLPAKSPTVEDKIKELAEKIRKVVDEPEDICKKKKTLSDLVNNLLLVIGSI